MARYIEYRIQICTIAFTLKAWYTILIMRAKNNIGAKINKNLLLLQVLISFNINFAPSAKGCNSPNTPTTEGPRRLGYLP